MFDILEADIIVMQELKIQRKDLGDDMVLLDGWDCFFSLPKHKKGMECSAPFSTIPLLGRSIESEFSELTET
jgi:exonuclease III